MTAQAAKRILVVEDEFLLAMHLEDLLISLGHEVVAQAARVDVAAELARKTEIDFAVLDINVAGTWSFPVANILCDRGIPFVFATGYGAEGLVDGYRRFPVLRKPYAQEDLEQAIAEACRTFAQ